MVTTNRYCGWLDVGVSRCGGISLVADSLVADSLVADSLVANETVESIAIVSSVLLRRVAFKFTPPSDSVLVGLEVVDLNVSSEISFNLSFRISRLSTNSMCNRRL